MSTDKPGSAPETPARHFTQEIIAEDDSFPANKAELTSQLEQYCGFRPEILKTLKVCRTVLAEEPKFGAENLAEAVKLWLGDSPTPLADINRVLRLAVTGQTVGMNAFQSTAVLGRVSCPRRIDNVATLC